MKHMISFEPAGCDQCGATSLKPVGDGKFQCNYCGAFMLEREPPPMEPPRDHTDLNRPPPSPVHNVSAVKVLQLGTQGEVPAPSDLEIAAILDKNGPTGFFTPKPLSKFVKITSSTGYAPVRIQYSIFNEKRSYEEVPVPYLGQQPATDQLPPLWSEPLRPEREITARRIPVPGQQRVATCPRCSGAGWLSCTHCGGDGRDPCSWCGGTGKRSRTEWRGEKSRTVRETCTSCNGAGWTSCVHCGGRGRVTCDTCDGKTRVLFTWERIEDFTAPTAMEALSHGRDWSDMRWMSAAEGELLFDRTVPGLMDLTETDGPIAQLADQVVLQHNHGLTESYAYWSRFTVTRVPVVEVQYKVGSKTGTLHIYGRDQKVSMPGKKPVGCLGIMLWALGSLGIAATIAATAAAALF